MKTPHIKSISQSLLRFGLLLIPLVLGRFALSPQARAACQEGYLTNQSTVLGDDVLLNSFGINNTAIGFYALANNRLSNNTAVGSFALVSNISGSENTATGVGAGVTKTASA
jgi:hypothetical protein